jgi:hypothetical protein
VLGRMSGSGLQKWAYAGLVLLIFYIITAGGL